MVPYPAAVSSRAYVAPAGPVKAEAAPVSASGAALMFFQEALTRTVSPGSRTLLTFEAVPPEAWASSTRPAGWTVLVQTHAAPAVPLSTGPPTIAVVPSAERDTETPS